MKIATVPMAARGVDTVTSIDAAHGEALKAAGVDFVARYIEALSSGEIAAILGAGLGLELVTYARAPGWLPTETLGGQDGASDVAFLQALGIPAGMLVWIDLEGSGGDAQDTQAWLTARSDAIVNAGFLAGCYVGAGCVLSGEELYAVPNVTRYWRAFNLGIPEPSCGFCQAQLFPPNASLAGLEIDYDVALRDYQRRAPLMLVAS